MNFWDSVLVNFGMLLLCVFILSLWVLNEEWWVRHMFYLFLKIHNIWWVRNWQKRSCVHLSFCNCAISFSGYFCIKKHLKNNLYFSYIVSNYLPPAISAWQTPSCRLFSSFLCLLVIVFSYSLALDEMTKIFFFLYSYSRRFVFLIHNDMGWYFILMLIMGK
jgi:hypothetical protein